MGQDAVGAFASHRITDGRIRQRRTTTTLGAVVVVASFAGALIGRLLGA
jgi:hypothetical protein